MNKSRQTSFEFFRSQKSFGGTLLRDKGNRVARPVSSRHALHVVFKSSRAVGGLSFLRPRSRHIINYTLDEMSARYGLRILETGICSNHFHLLVRFHHRRGLLAFLRVFSGTMVKRLCGTAKLERKFFDFRPFTRVVASGRRTYHIIKDYVLLNKLEGLGIIPCQKERTRSAWWRESPEVSRAKAENEQARRPGAHPGRGPRANRNDSPPPSWAWRWRRRIFGGRRPPPTPR